ncbi:phosphoserine phosphatase [Gallibacterium genomosp. 3]|uniref:Phosphoserine phosphatase n=1 Tax=Gallibacterium genomosp. 3 TaxID=505345 RepID=A0A1A7PSD5_9PAST|nr:phosphoserine phosphatase [Gallibacterium genomosp. 3]OBX04954.1 phosphoserine phosphatase [Gallibacterium genomosp. 3]
MQTLFPVLPKPTHYQPDLPRFLLYTNSFTPEKLAQFLQQTEQVQQLAEWDIFEYHCVLLQHPDPAQYIALAHQLSFDLFILSTTPILDQAGLLVMDMDSTAIEIECIDEVAKLAGTGEMVAAITESAMRGELDFKQSLRRRVATLKGASATILDQVRNHLPIMSGLERTLTELQKLGWKVAIASGGFTYFAEVLQQKFGLVAVYANRFQIKDGFLTGEVEGEIVDAQYKANVLQQLAQQHHIDIQQCIAIGDGANDLLMMQAAGLGVAYHAKPKVQQQAQTMVNFADLTALLCILSANQQDFYFQQQK